MKRHALLLALVLVGALGLIGCGSEPAAETTTTTAAVAPTTTQQTTTVTEPKEPYKIGLVATQSGPMASQGSDFRDGVVLEVDRINAAGGVDGHLIDLVMEDDGFDPTRAATSLTKLINQDEVLAVIGAWGSFFEATTRPVTEREQVAQLIGNPTFPEMRDQHFKWSFNLSPNEIIGAEAVLEIVKYKGVKKVAVISESTALMQSMQASFESIASAAGIEVVVLGDTMDVKAVDVTPQVTKLKELIAKEKPEAVVAFISGSGPAFLKAVKQLSIDVPVIGDHAVGSQWILTVAGEDANGMMAPGSKVVAPDQIPDGDPQKATIVDFVTRFQEKYGRPPGPASAGADAVNILAAALKVAGPDRSAIRDAIENTKGLVGVLGVFNYSPDNHEGLDKSALVIYEVQNGAFKLIKTLQ